METEKNKFIYNGESNYSGVMTPKEVGDYLKISTQAVRKMLISGELPALKLNGKYKIVKKILDKWMVMKSFGIARSAEFLSGGVVKDEILDKNSKEKDIKHLTSDDEEGW